MLVVSTNIAKGRFHVIAIIIVIIVRGDKQVEKKIVRGVYYYYCY